LLADQYRIAAEAKLDGFGLNAAIFARFDGALDPASLPDPAASQQPGASVYLVNLDAVSPNRGQRTPLIAHFRADGTSTIAATGSWCGRIPGSVSTRVRPTRS